jgi:hypothetical protein
MRSRFGGRAICSRPSPDLEHYVRQRAASKNKSLSLNKLVPVYCAGPRTATEAQSPAGQNRPLDKLVRFYLK